MLDTLISGGTVVTSGMRFRGDVGIKDGVIAGLWASGTAPQAAVVVDASGKLVIPGGIDGHLHTRTGDQATSTRADDMHTVTASAAMGGITTVIPFVNGDPGQRVEDYLSKFFELAERLAVCDFAAHCGLRADMAVIAQIPDAVAMGVTSFKMYLAYRRTHPGTMSDDDHRLAAMELIGRAHGTAMFHCENGYVIDYLEQKLIASGDTSHRSFLRSRPNAAEAEAVHRTIVLGELAGCRVYIVHLSTREGLAEVVVARAAGRNVATETCPQYLTMTNDDLEHLGALAKIGPPLRTAADVEALWTGLRLGHIGIVGSDHSGRTLEDKRSGSTFFDAPFGTPMVEVMLPIVFHEGVVRGRLAIEQFVSCFTEGPAKQFGLYPRKGVIKPGSDADILVWDPDVEWTIEASRLASPSGFSVYEGKRVRGRLVRSWLRGRPLVVDGHVVLPPGSGRRAA